MNLRFLFFSVLLVLIGCASPSKTLKSGDYKKAYKQSRNQLKRGKSVTENKVVLSKSLKKIVDDGQKDIVQKLDTKTIEDLQAAFKINKDLQSKVEDAQEYITDGSFDETYFALVDESDWMEEEIAVAYFDFAQADLTESIETGIKHLARTAFKDFQTAKKFGYQGENIDSLQQVCIQYGKLVYTIDAKVTFGISYDWDVDRRFDDLEDYSGTFRKIYFERSGVSDVDCHLDIDFRSIDVNNSEDRSTERFERNVQTGTTEVTDADGNVTEQPIFEDVKGEVSIITRRKVVSSDVSVSVRSVSKNCNLSDNRFSEEIVAQIEETVWSGDERAIPDQYKSRNRDELPDDDDMAEELIDRLYDRIAGTYF